MLNMSSQKGCSEFREAREGISKQVDDLTGMCQYLLQHVQNGPHDCGDQEDEDDLERDAAYRCQQHVSTTSCYENQDRVRKGWSWNEKYQSCEQEL